MFSDFRIQRFIKILPSYFPFVFKTIVNTNGFGPAKSSFQLSCPRAFHFFEHWPSGLFIVSKLPNFILCFLVDLGPILPKSHACLLVDIGPTSKIIKILLTDLHNFVGAQFSPKNKTWNQDFEIYENNTLSNDLRCF